ncbi:hypothetical protein [Mycolicibacterium gadium]|uniref:Uncharacterized protein n=1 Tax=Mycolicibacterium gadium TaxID=1794 RepID=A0A7I7WPJ9_MYCGU|nr:hypothetical protein [Mycolicibacterium gadium]BBZ18627.1 hypothetical protein MGAD_29620 [Mycolicibacterium gadium]
MTITRNETPRLASAAERRVYQVLLDQLQPNDRVIPGQRVTDHLKDYEVDRVGNRAGSELGVTAIDLTMIDLWDELTDVGESARQIADDRRATESLQKSRLRDHEDMKRTIAEDKKLRKEARSLSWPPASIRSPVTGTTCSGSALPLGVTRTRSVGPFDEYLTSRQQTVWSERCRVRLPLLGVVHSKSARD